MDADQKEVQTGLNRIALVAMYRLWREQSEEDRVTRVQAIFNENDLDTTLDTMCAIVAGLNLPSEAPAQQAPAASARPSMDGGYL